MSWTPLSPLSTSSNSPAAVTLAARPAGRSAACTTIAMRMALLDGCEFLVDGARVKVLAGGGEHAGMLRITPGGTFPLHRAGGRGSPGGVLWLRLPLPTGVHLSAKRRREAVEFDYAGGWLEVTLPDWARSPTKMPFFPVSHRTPDPAAALRGRR